MVLAYLIKGPGLIRCDFGVDCMNIELILALFLYNADRNLFYGLLISVECDFSMTV